jgi:hypothetical protein
MCDLNAQVISPSQIMFGSQPLVDAVAINSFGAVLADDITGNCYLLAPQK